MKDGKIESFTDLNVWKEGHILVLMIYKVTKYDLRKIVLFERSRELLDFANATLEQ